jgi:replication initiation protein RepC
MRTAEINVGKSVDKWKVFRAACEARAALGVQDRALAVLNALLTFYPESELSEDRDLVVFPSNEQLSIRAHGIAGTTLRRHLAALVEAGLIQRKDSANGKRYARKGNAGTIEEAFGFSLAPLLARAEELAHLAQQIAAERRRFRATKEALSICRRDVRKLLTAAIEEGAARDWRGIEDMFVELIGRIPRTPTVADIEPILDEMQKLRDEIINRLEIQENSENMDINDVRNEHHIQNSNTESTNELEPSSGKELGAKLRPEIRPMREPVKAFPLEIVLQACPAIRDYGPNGAIGSWRDLLSAAVVVRSMLGVSPSAYEEARGILGAENAAAVMACILERAGHINSAGGYLRDLTRRAERGEFSLGPMLMALMRTSTGPRKASA